MINPLYRVERLRREHNRDNFDSGEPSLNEFLKRFARQNDEKGLGRTYVTVFDENPLEIAGYYTLSSGAVEFEKVLENLPKYPVPIVHLGRLAVSVSAQGFGIGKLLFFDALRRTMNVAGEIGVFAVEVYTLNQSAKEFYLKYGFAELTDDEFHLYLPMKKLRKLFENE
jgi:GNAT superfamily N-acetyltransferase